MKDEIFDELLESVKEARTGLSQDKFALLIGVNPATLRNWEQGRRRPTGPARALLRILDADTERAILALHPKRS